MDYIISDDFIEIKHEKTAKDVMKERASNAQKVMEETMEDLFSGDKEYDEQCAEGDRQGLVDAAINFIGLKVQKTCENCVWNHNGLCHVMQMFNQDLLLPVGTSKKCTHWKKEE